MQNTSTPSYQLVYAIQSVNLKTVKIGYSTDVNQRLSNLQSGSPDELKIIGCWLGTESDEKQMHGRFDYCRMHREWFYPSKELLEAVAERNQAVKTDTPGKLQLQISKTKSVEIWETCRDERRQRVQITNAYRRRKSGYGLYLTVCPMSSRHSLRMKRLS